MKIRPKAGMTVRDPHTKQPLPPEGAEVAEDTYWLRRLRSGDVERMDEASKPTGLEPVTPLTTR